MRCSEAGSTVPNNSSTISTGQQVSKCFPRSSGSNYVLVVSLRRQPLSPSAPPILAATACSTRRSTARTRGAGAPRA
eukprot:4013376-Pleurochrysis_carterae.AAC.1